MLQVFDNAFNIKLPRNSAKQQQYCQAIARSELQIGDLVFFTTRSGSDVGHVGIYVGNGNMIHASSTAGVVITALSSAYFTNHFHSAGRVTAYAGRVNAEKRKTKSTKASSGSTTTHPKTMQQVGQQKASADTRDSSETVSTSIPDIFE